MYRLLDLLARSALAAAALLLPNPGGVLLAPAISLYFLLTPGHAGVTVGAVVFAAAVLVSHRMGQRRDAVRQMAVTLAGSEARSRCKRFEAQHWTQSDSQRWKVCALLWEFSPSLASQTGERTLRRSTLWAWKDELLSTTWETLLHWHVCALAVYSSQTSTSFLGRRELERRLALVMAGATGAPNEDLDEEVGWVLALGELPLECSIVDVLSAVQKGLFTALAGLQRWEGLVHRLEDDAGANDCLRRACEEAATFRELRQAITAAMCSTTTPKDALLSYVRDILMFPTSEAESVAEHFPPTSDLCSALSLRRVLVQINILRAAKAK